MSLNRTRRLTIPEGNVSRITNLAGYVIWAAYTETIHNITVSNVTGGLVSINTSSAIPGTIITLTIIADSGYQYNGATISYTEGGIAKTIELDKKTKTFSMPASDITVTPKWAELTITVTYNANGGKFTSGTTNVMVYTVKDGILTLESGIYEDPTTTVANSYFDGWYTDAACTDGNEFDLASAVSDITVYANWEVPTAILYNDGTFVFQNNNDTDTATHGPVVASYTGWINSSWSSGQIPWYEYESNGSITSVVINDDVSPSNIQFWFYYATALKDVYFGGVTNIEGTTFSSMCTSLESVTITDSITSIGDGAFKGCISLKSIVIPDSVTSIGKNAFDGCTSLRNVTINGNISIINDYTFQNCTSLTNFTIPNSVTSIGKYAFYGCTSLTKFTIPDSVTSIGNNAFNGCANLKSIIIPDNVTIIEVFSFANCTKLSNIIIPDSVTHIKSNAFSNCTSLESIIIPDSVTSIESNAF